MSRVGKLPVAVPEGVQVNVEGNRIVVKGKLGELTARYPSEVTVALNDGNVDVAPANDSKFARSAWGTIRSIVSNMVKGVCEGYEQRLEVNGVGYRCSLDGRILTLSLGYSHDIKYAIPEGVEIKCEKQTKLIVSGADKQRVGQVCGELIKLRPVEPYKGKGVYKEGAYIRRKEGKKK